MDPIDMIDPRTVWQAREAGWEHLVVQCPACPHTVTLPWDRLSVGDRVADVGLRMRCTACGHRGAQTWAYMDPRRWERLKRLVRS